MKFQAIYLLLAATLVAGGCRHYETAPAPYYCPSGCGCAPASNCTPACNPCANPCAPTARTYLTPTPTAIPATSAPYTTTVTPAPGTYAPAGTYPAGNASPSVPSR
jgi:hypothetical protein